MLWYVLPLAIAVALSIFPVLAALLLLLASDPTKPSALYALGWSLGLIVLVSTFAFGARMVPKDPSRSMPSWVHYVEIAVGAVLVVEGIVSAMHQRRRATPTAPPEWLQVASSLDARRAFAFGVFMNVRPKNLALTFAAGIAIGAAPITLFLGGVAILVFTVVGVSTVVGLVLANVLAPRRVGPMLRALHGWLMSNASLVLRLSFVVIGVILVTIGLSAL